MKQQYMSPKIEIIKFENSDIICTSSCILAAESLNLEGTSLGNVNYSELNTAAALTD